MNKEKKPDRGHAIKAGQLLSKWLRQIAEEPTELIKNEDNEFETVTKAEAVARLIWKKALGWVEEETDDKGIVTKIYHAPDRAMISMIFDRIEGRAPVSTDVGKKKRAIADKVSEQGTKRIVDAGNKTKSET